MVTIDRSTTMRTPLIGAAVLALAIPASASAHTATIACDPLGGPPIVSAPTYRGATAAVTLTATSALVVWSDGYRVRLSLPPACPPPPPPVVPPVEPPPPVAPPPPVVAEPVAPTAPPATPAPASPGTPSPATAPRPRARVITCAWLRARNAGPRRYTARGWRYRCAASTRPPVSLPPLRGRVPAFTG